MDDLWADLERAERQAAGHDARTSTAIPSDAELEAPPTLHPVPLEHAADAAVGEVVTARMLDGELRDWILTGLTVPPRDLPDLPAELRDTELCGITDRLLWLQHTTYPETFPLVLQGWPQTRLWVWREATAPTDEAAIPDAFDWMRRAVATSADGDPAPRVPIRAQNAGPLTGREVTVRQLDGPTPGPWRSVVAVGEIEDGPNGFVVPFRERDSYDRLSLNAQVTGGISRFPVHRVWVRA